MSMNLVAFSAYLKGACEGHHPLPTITYMMPATHGDFVPRSYIYYGYSYDVFECSYTCHVCILCRLHPCHNIIIILYAQ